MHIRIVQSGGFAGLRREKVVETSGLPARERAALERLVTACGFFALPARPDAGGAAVAGGAGEVAAHRDAHQFDVEIEDDAGRLHAVRVSEHAKNGALKDLVDRVWAAGGDSVAAP
jgi:hypothetical protein